MEEKKIKRCSYAIPDLSFNSGCLQHRCKKENKEITENDCETCAKYHSRYIEYPIEVESIELAEGFDLYEKSVGKVVKIKPCIENIEDKEYLGIFLGELYSFNSVAYKQKTKHLTVTPVFNPAIYIPELKKIVYGFESWWSFVDTEEEIMKASNNEWESMFYLKALK